MSDWSQSIDSLNNGQAASRAEGIAEGVSEGDLVRRRDFLTLLASSFAALGLTSCDVRSPRQTIIPWRDQPEHTLSGLPTWYSSTCRACPASCGVLVKNREGRPIKLEGNPDHPISRGGLCARGQASVLDLYDSERLKTPLAKGEATDFAQLDAAVIGALRSIRDRGESIRIVTSGDDGPAARRAIEIFQAAFPDTRVVEHHPLATRAIARAHGATQGTARIPSYRFNKAELVVSFDADFLGTWISPVGFTRDWADARDPELNGGKMARLVSLDPRMSLTGANADFRVALKPSAVGATLLHLLVHVGRKLGKREVESIAGRLPAIPIPDAVDDEILGGLAEELVAARGRSLVIAGSESAADQIIINIINEWLGSYGATIDLARPVWEEADDLDSLDTPDALETLIADIESAGTQAGSGAQAESDDNRAVPGAVIFLGANPVYNHPRGAELRRALEKVPLKIALCDRLDETAALADWICPTPHALESWDIARPRRGTYSIVQPTIAPLFGSRPAVTSLTTWAGKPTEAYKLVRRVWRDEVFERQSQFDRFEKFWVECLQKGAFEIEDATPDASFTRPPLAGLVELAVVESVLAQNENGNRAEGDLEFLAYPSIALGDGSQANNPWLQELPDPISKITWGNVGAISPATARELGLEEGRVVEIRAEADTGLGPVRMPIHIQPGMAEGVLATALGYGRTHAGRIAANYPIERVFGIDKAEPGGADVYPLLGVGSVSVTPTNGFDEPARTQLYDHQTEPFTGEDRNPAREMSFADFIKQGRENGHGDAGGNSEHGGQSETDKHLKHGAHAAEPTLWSEHDYPGHKWTMAIDLNRCTGCAACVVACQAENNIPVVGKAEVRKKRDMHWMRIDRYYSGSPEAPEAEPDVAFEPMLCQQCDHAPCETVCPVLATVHSSEGLNMQVYNRCVGTRYCANNCQYKVRRFNWFDYAHEDLVQNFVLNPDVTVRSRGVMEKCTFCVQRLNAGKRDAASDGRPVADADVRPACAQSCPAAAIVLGDANDPQSAVSRALENPRAYSVLEPLGTRPSVRYLARIRKEDATS